MLPRCEMMSVAKYVSALLQEFLEARTKNSPRSEPEASGKSVYRRSGLVTETQAGFNSTYGWIVPLKVVRDEVSTKAVAEVKDKERGPGSRVNRTDRAAGAACALNKRSRGRESLLSIRFPSIWPFVGHSSPILVPRRSPLTSAFQVMLVPQDPADQERLKSWLISILVPLCQADPEALAKYIMALIKKDKQEDELKNVCLDQLKVFLEDHTKSFVDVFFTALKDKSYLASTSNFNSSQQSGNTVKSNSSMASSGITTDPSLSSSSHVPNIIGSSTSSSNAEVPCGSQYHKTQPHPPKYHSGDPIGDSTLQRKRSRSRSPANQSRNANSRRGDDARDSYRGHPRRFKEKTAVRRGAKRSASRSPSPSRPTEGTSLRNRNKLRPSDRERSRSRSRSHDRDDTRRMRSSRRAAPKSSDSRVRQPASTVVEIDTKRKERCRDFDEKGVCLLGDLCLYDHGSDPVVLEGVTGPIFNLPPSTSSVASTATPTTPSSQVTEVSTNRAGNSEWPPEYDPREPISGSNVLVATATTAPVRSGTWNYAPSRIGHSTAANNSNATQAANSRPNLNLIIPDGQSERTSQVEPPSKPQPPQVQANPPSAHQTNFGNQHDQQQQQPMTHHRRGRAFARGMRGGRYGGRRHMPTDQPEKCTLEVRKLPHQLNTITKLNEFFSKFGTIVNLQVRYGGDPEAAVVQFATHSEAVAAHRSPEAVLGNRFIKLFWHNKEQEKLDPAPEKSASGEDEGENKNQISKSNSDVESNVNASDSTVAKPNSDDEVKANSASDAANLSNEASNAPNCGPRGVLSQPNPMQLPTRKQLTKSNIPPPTSSSSVNSPSSVPMTKTPSEQKKEKLLQKIEIKKKCQEILEQVRQDQASVGQKLLSASKEERPELKKLFDTLDEKRKKLEEDLKKVTEDLLRETKNPPKRGRERPNANTLTGSFPTVTSPSKKTAKDLN